MVSARLGGGGGRTPSATPSSLLLLLLLRLLLPPLRDGPSTTTFVLALTTSHEYYCGTSWPDAAHNCPYHCPSGEDRECRDALGEGYGCFYFTACTPEKQALWEAANRPDVDDDDGEDGGDENEGGDDEGEDGIEDVEEAELDLGGGGPQTSVAANNNFCGSSWISAMFTCDDPCPMGWECVEPGASCYAATGCDKPLETLLSEMMTTLNGPDSLMEDEDMEIFGGSIFDLLTSAVEELGVSLDEVDLGEQSLVGRRELKRRIKRRSLEGHEVFGAAYLGYSLRNVTRRRLPSGSSAVDVSMVVTGDYRPPPYVDLDVVAQDSINRNGAKVVNTLRERGERAGRDFFRRVDSIEAVAKKEMTRRPTRSPVREPTISPIGPPTGRPSMMPTYFPSTSPSMAPSRMHDQVIVTGSRNDLELGGTTTSSYGYVWNIRTKPESGVVLMTGFDFYTESTNEITFEVWSREGSFKGHKGSYDGWDLIASGTTKGRGIGRYTAIPEEMFTPVSIPGGGEANGGIRAFYITLETRELVYKLRDAGDVQLAASDATHHADSEDIEVYEGESILWYPFPDPSEVMFYRFPRQYLGAIYYNRLPCRPFSLYGVQNQLPCPLVPTGSPTVPPPTRSPVTSPPSTSPVHSPTWMPSREPTISPLAGQTPAPVEPTELPTVSPTESLEPTMAPTTAEPTMSPVVPMRAYVVATLRNIPERAMTVREEEKFVEIVTAFLRRHTENSMVLDGIDLWHQEIIMVEAMEGYVSPHAEANDGGKDDAKSSQVARGAVRDLKGGSGGGSRHVGKKKKSRPPPPVVRVPAMDITLILKVQISNLPPSMLGNMAKVAVEEHEGELLALLKEQQAFYTFFKFADGVAARVIDDVTNPPSVSPTTKEAYLARQAELERLEALASMREGEEGAKGREAFGIFVGLGVGFLWCALTGVSVAYLLSARGEMEEQRGMEELLKAEKANPLGDDEDEDDDDAEGKNEKDDPDADEKAKAQEKLRRSSTVPLDEDDKDDGDDNDKSLTSSVTESMMDGSAVWDQSKNKRLTPVARAKLSRSVGEDNNPPRPFSSSVNHSDSAPRKAGAMTRPTRSMIVTSKESRAMQDADLKRSRGGNNGGTGGGGGDAGTVMSSLFSITGPPGDDKAPRKKDAFAKFKSSSMPTSIEVTLEKKNERALRASGRGAGHILSSKERRAMSKSVFVSSGDDGGGISSKGRRDFSKSVVVSVGGGGPPSKEERRALSKSVTESSIGGGPSSKEERRVGAGRAGPSSKERRVLSKSAVVSSGDGGGGLRRSARKGSHDNLHGLRRSSVNVKERGSHDNLHSLRRSTAKGSHGDLHSMRRSSNARGSHGDLHSMRRSSNARGSHDNLHSPRRSTAKGSHGDLRSMRRSSRDPPDIVSLTRSGSRSVRGDDEKKRLSKSDTSIAKVNRGGGRPGTMLGKSMIV